MNSTHSLLTAAVFVAVAYASSAALPEGNNGLARKYRGDKGIEEDPKVVFVEKYDEDSIEKLANRYDSVKGKECMSFSNNGVRGSAENQCLLMTHTGGQGTGGHLYNRLAGRNRGYGRDKVFARFYVKFDEDCAQIHHFGTTLGGMNPPVRWPNAGAGVRPERDKRFWIGVEPYAGRWVWDYYAYWHEMGGSPPKGKTWGNSFIRDPDLKVARGKWICVELMVKMNDVGDTNGELACWIDGKLVSHLGKGFPKGKWTFDKFEPGAGGDSVLWDDEKGGPVHSTVPAGGAPFEGFRWRTSENLNVNNVWTYVFITKAPKGHESKVWFDNLVVAEEYVGPMNSL